MKIFVAKLSSETTSEDLQTLFSQFGEVTSVKVIFDKETGNSKRYGFVELADAIAATEAINQLNNSEFQGSTIAVKESLPQEPKQHDNRSYDRNSQQRRGGYSSHGGGNRDYNRGGGYGQRRESSYGNREYGQGDRGGYGQGDRSHGSGDDSQRRSFRSRPDDRRY